MSVSLAPTQSTQKPNESVEFEEVIASFRHHHMTWAARVNGDYRYSGTLLRRVRPSTKIAGVTGGFSRDLQLPFKYGTFTTAPTLQAQAAFFKKFQTSIPKSSRLLNAMRLMSQDVYVFEALQQFFRDGGRVQLIHGTSHYMGKPLVILIDDSPAVSNDVFHELLHYVMDKNDSMLWEYEGDQIGGFDHAFLIPALEDRFDLLSIIRSGRFPNQSDRIGRTRTSTDGRAIIAQIERYIEEQDWRGLQSFVDYNLRYYKTYVNEMMVGSLSVAEELEKRTPGQSPITPSDLRDVASIYALNAQILRGSIRIATAEAISKQVSFESVLKTRAYQDLFDHFLHQLLDAMEGDPNGSVRETATAILSAILSPNASIKSVRSPFDGPRTAQTRSAA